MKSPFALSNRENHHEIADIFNRYGDQYRQNNSTSCDQAKVMRHIQHAAQQHLADMLNNATSVAMKKLPTIPAGIDIVQNAKP